MTESHRRHTLGRADRLTARADVAAVFSKGRRVAGRHLTLHTMCNMRGGNRVLVTTRRGFRTAVARNRARRVGREAYRRLGPWLHPGYDIVLAIHPAAVAHDRLCVEVESLLRRAGVLDKDR